MIKVYAVIALVIAGLFGWAMYERKSAQVAVRDKQIAEEQLGRAIAVNQANAKAMRDLSIDRQIERELTAQELERTQRRLAQSQQLVREMRNVPGANAPAGPVWDEYSRRLRGAAAGGTPSH